MNGAIFDMDGLMFDTERVHIQAWDYAADKLGWNCPGIDMVKKTLGMSIPAAGGVLRAGGFQKRSPVRTCCGM